MSNAEEFHERDRAANQAHEEEAKAEYEPTPPAPSGPDDPPVDPDQPTNSA